MFLGNLLIIFLGSLRIILLYYMSYLYIINELIYIEWNFIILNSVEFNIIFLFDWISFFLLDILYLFLQ